MNIIETLAKEFNVNEHRIENTVALLDEGNTIPFIARYRKEATGSLDDQLLRSIADRLDYLRSLAEQKEKVTASITEQGAMTDGLAAAIESAATLTELEDIYRPYRPKRKTRASVAKARGLEPLAKAILEQKDNFDPLSAAREFINEEVLTAQDALDGAKDIIAEIISDDANVRRQLRYMLRTHGTVTAKAAGDDPGVYENYADYAEPVSKIANHRILAVNRAEKENVLKVGIELDKAIGMSVLTGLYVNGTNASSQLVREAAEDSYSRLVYPAVEREIRNDLTQRANSPALLQRVSGITASVAENIVKYREENGAFTSRKQLMKVPKLGPKAFEQCAGFLRIPGAENVLDNTAVHPESYETAEKLLALCGVSNQDVAAGNITAVTKTVEQQGITALAKELDTGVPTLADIVSEIGKPGRDPRDELPPPMLRTDVMGIEDLKPGMELKGTVRNVIDFGAFVDVGVHQDGLVHISQISNRFIRHPSEVLKVGQIVTVWVLSVDPAKNRISLTMKKPE